MISPGKFYEVLSGLGLEFFTGVPDSLLKDLCAFITDHVSPDNHVINANEGAAVAVAAGYHLATGRIPVVYLQNSGTGNIINPLLSLTHPAVYQIPMLFLIGWRGEPGIPDEPQHVAQGRLMIPLLKALEVDFDVLEADSKNMREVVRRAVEGMGVTGRSHVLLIRKKTFSEYSWRKVQRETFELTREQAIGVVLEQLEDDDLIVSTTGMTSREIFEYREQQRQGHNRDFLTVGSMGHCSQIALGLAQQVPGRRVVCLDGDGSLIMHMGSLAIIGTQQPRNLLHIVLNNGAHDSVGGQPTAGLAINICAIARACGYRLAQTVESGEHTAAAVRRLVAEKGPVLLEIRIRKGARPDLGRPTSSPLQNKLAFMEALGNE